MQNSTNQTSKIAMAEGRPIETDLTGWLWVWRGQRDHREFFVLRKPKTGPLDEVKYPRGVGDEQLWLVYEVSDLRAQNGRLLNCPDDADLETAIKRVIGHHPGLIHQALDALPPRKI